ncbi:GyrI-like domain-containing protein [Actinokineospora cianjurensis]|uniref:Effector-binding domain-containing protein n=1 Tax=Actinokineospora cianjurensis TaxID=585224 RepID=A0A421BCL5_9PSEU|nr:GyrI-like domain-containing protein [Actinokineospora cianjurensis]RLK62122.1 effector-binding domain-containing protein [Actinokineospora cianjurensis]
MQPTIETRAEQPYVSIRTQATLAEWGRVNALIGQVYGWITERDLAPAGALFYRYHSVTDDVLDVEVGVPLAVAVAGDDTVAAGSKPAGQYAVLIHRGHPDRIRETFAALDEWSTATSVEFDVTDGIWAGRFESYLSDPAEVPDLADWRTEVAYRVRH